MGAHAFAVALIVGADVGIRRAPGTRGLTTVVGGLVTAIVAFRSTDTRIPGVAAGATAARVDPVTEEAVVARRRVRRMRAYACAIALIVGAGVVIGRAARARWLAAVVGGLVTAIVAFRSTDTRVAGVGAGAPAARVGPVAEEAVVTQCRVRGMRAYACAIALIVGADIVIGRARGAHGLTAVVSGLVTAIVAFRSTDTRVAGVAAGATAARVGPVAKDPVVARASILLYAA
jgi:hypothetical protein